MFCNGRIGSLHYHTVFNLLKFHGAALVCGGVVKRLDELFVVHLIAFEYIGLVLRLVEDSYHLLELSVLLFSLHLLGMRDSFVGLLLFLYHRFHTRNILHAESSSKYRDLYRTLLKIVVLAVSPDELDVIFLELCHECLNLGHLLNADRGVGVLVYVEENLLRLVYVVVIEQRRVKGALECS